MPESPQTPKAEGTAVQLIAAGIRLFGAKGFVATSTREIATSAETNVASIAYHFGGKDGLRRACGQEVIRRMGAVIAPALPDDEAKSPAVAAAVLEGVVRAMTAFLLTRPEAEDFVPFMLREILEQGPVLDEVYDTLFAPTHSRLCGLWSAATGRPAEADRTRLTIFSLIGALVYFRIGRPIVLRRMGWQVAGPDEARQIADVVSMNLHAIIERERRT